MNYDHQDEQIVQPSKAAIFLASERSKQQHNCENRQLIQNSLMLEARFTQLHKNVTARLIA